MSGSPTFTIVLSRPTMNRLMQQTASIRPRRPRPAAGWGHRSSGLGPRGRRRGLWAGGEGGLGPGVAGGAGARPQRGPGRNPILDAVPGRMYPERGTRAVFRGELEPQDGHRHPFW